MSEAVTVIAGFDDMTVMRQSVQQCGCQLCITEDRRPFREAQVGCYDDAGLLVELADEVEQQGLTGLAERQIAQFIEYHQVCMHQSVSDTTLFAIKFFLLQLIDQFDGGQEAYSQVMMLYRLHGNGSSQVGFAGTWASTSTISRSPPGRLRNFFWSCLKLSGNSWNGAPLRKAPGLR